VIFTPDGRIIQLTKYSSCLLIPTTFYDAKYLKDELDSLNNLQNIHQSQKSSAKKSIGKKMLPGDFEETQLNRQYNRDKILIANPFLIDYEFDHKLNIDEDSNRLSSFGNEITMVKKKYLNKNTTSVKEIFEILDGYENSNCEN